MLHVKRNEKVCYPEFVITVWSHKVHFNKTKGDSQDEWHISWEWELQALSSPTGILSQIFFGLVAESIWPLVVILRQWP